MTLDEQLLKKARTQGAQAAEAERQAQLSRADYHTAVRRLHLAGGSLREIAEALGVSHQRVQQIVNDAGGSWWRRVWRTRIVKRDAVCTYCDRPPSEVAKLIAGPNVYICDACVTRAENALAGGADRGPAVLSRSITARCAFCRKRRNAERPLIAQPAANICGDCLRLCRQILDDRAA
jgi:hypothetical protein